MLFSDTGHGVQSKRSVYTADMHLVYGVWSGAFTRMGGQGDFQCTESELSEWNGRQGPRRATRCMEVARAPRGENSVVNHAMISCRLLAFIARQSDTDSVPFGMLPTCAFLYFFIFLYRFPPLLLTAQPTASMEHDRRPFLRRWASLSILPCRILKHAHDRAEPFPIRISECHAVCIYRSCDSHK